MVADSRHPLDDLENSISIRTVTQFTSAMMVCVEDRVAVYFFILYVILGVCAAAFLL